MDYQAANGREHSDDNGPRSEGSAAALTLPGLAGAVAAGAVPLTPGPDGVIVLPAGVELDDILVRGRDLVIQTGDGRVYIIVDGAVYVPTLVIDGVTVPPLNLAALLNGAEIQPAAGLNQSSGNNFAVPPGDIQDAYKIGDLLPYTDFGREPETDDEVIPGLIDREPDVLIQDGAPPSKNAEDSVSEAGLPGTRLNGNVESPGSSSADNSEATTGTIIITSPDGIASVTINGTTVNLAGGTSITTPIGRLDLGPLVSGEIGYTYTLIDNLTDNSITDVFTVIVTDPDGDSSTATLTVSIVDDVPTASPDTNTVIEGALLSVAANGVLANDTAGADGFAAGGGVVGVAAGSNVNQTLSTGVNTAIVGTYGTLTLQANGSYTYKADPNKVTANAVDRFVYTIRDGDGDPSTTTLDINVTNVTLTGANVTRTVDEAALDTVTTPPDLGNGTVTGSTGTNSGAETVTGTLSNANAAANGYTPQSVTTTYGKFQLNADGTFTYTLINPVPSGANPGPNTVPGVEQFTYTFADANGNTGTGTVTIDVIDDVATARDDGSAATPYVIAENTPLTINVLANDTFGADGQGAPAITGFTQPANGTVTLNADNTLTITPSGPGAFGPDSFTYTIKDGDGDTSTATVYLDFAADSVPNIGTPQNVTVDEDGFTGVPVSANVDKVPVQGSPAEIDSNELLVNTGKVIVAFGADKPAAPLSNIDFVNFTALDGLLKTVNGDVDFTQPGGPGTAIVGNDGTNDVIVISFTGAVDGPNPGEVEYTYQVELKQPLMHPDGNGEASQTLSGIQFQVTDSDGTQAVTPGQFNAIIFDDVPQPKGTTYDVGLVHEDALATAAATGNQEGGQTATATILTASLQGLVSAGADVPLTIALNSALTGATGLTQNGNAINWNYVSATQIDGIVGADATKVVFSITQSGGNWLFTLKDNIDHDDDANLATGTNDAFATPLSLANVFVASDSDKDAVVIGAGVSVSIQNDVPKLSGTPYDIGEVHEDALATPGATGNSEGGGQTAQATILTASLQSMVSPGADAPVTISLNGALTGATGLTQNGTAINWNYVSATQIDGIVGADASAVVFSITQSGGNWLFTLKDNIDHGTLIDQQLDSDVETLSLANVFVATDSDGDSVPISSGLSIDIENDIPKLTGTTYDLGEVHEDVLNNPPDDVGNGEVTVPAQSATATILTATLQTMVSAGADSPATFVLNSALTGATGLTQGGTAINWNYVSATQIDGIVGADTSKVVFSITQSGGNWLFTLKDNVDHGTLLDHNGDDFPTTLSLANVFIAVDSDGDRLPISSGISVDIENDVPIATNDRSAADPYVVAENTPLTINVLANDSFGADGSASTPIIGFTQPSIGSVTLNANNTFTVTPPANGSGPATFTYTIRDGDGDTSTATVYLDFAADSVPNIGTPQNVTVDEDGFTGVPVSANVDKVPVQGSPAEIDSNELLVNTGKVIVAFGADKPAAPLSNIDFVNFTALDGLLKTVNGDVDFTQPGGPGTAIVGNDGTNDVIVISFTGAVDGPNPGEVEYTYQVELKQPLMHPDGNGEASQTLSGIQFQVTDSDGTQAVTPGQFNAVIFDDVPSLSVSDTPNTVVEGQLLNTGTWNQTIGADSAGAVTKVVFNATEYNLDTNIATGFGTLRVNSDGTWTFQANNNVNNNPNPTVTFTVRVTDGDLDVAQDPQTITITDGAGPSATKNATINVDEEGLGTVNATGTNDTANSENGNDTVTFQAGSDNIVSVAFESPLVGLTADVNGIAGDDIVWVRDSGTVIRGEIGGITAITITLTPPTLPITPGNSGNATISVVLSDNFPHPNANGENNIEISGLSVIATDTDGTSIPASVTINVKDDVPINNSATLSRTVHEDALNNANAVGNNEGGKTTMASITAAALATLVTAGADAPVTISLNSAIDGALTGLEQGGTAIYWDYVSATQVRGLVNNDSSKVAFTLSWNAGTSSYDFELLDNVDHGTLLDDNGDAFTTSLSLANVFAATDSDGDPVVINAGATILIENDIPALIAATSQVAVGEDTLPGGNPDAGDAKTLTANGTLAGLVNFGADGPGSFAFDLTGQTPPALTSGGLTVKYAVSPDGLTLIGYTGATSADGQVFTVAFTNATTGAYTFTLKDQLDHLPNSPANDDNQNLTIQLSALVVAKDADGDVVRLTSGFSVLVEDDIPAPYSTAPAAVVATNTGTDYTTAPLSLNLPSIGADQPGTVAFTQTSGTVTGFIGGSATPSNLQALGSNLTWSLKAGDATVLQAKTSGGVVAFEIDLDPANGTYTFSQYEQITAVQNVDILNLSSVGGGNVETRAINTANDFDLVISTKPGSTVNTNATEMGIGSGQSLSGTDALRIDFVTIASVSGGGNPTATYGKYYSVNSFKQNVSGVGNDNGTGGPQRADFQIRAIAVKDGSGNSPPTTPTTDGDNTFYGDANDEFLTNTTLNIYNSVNGSSTNGTLVASYDLSGNLVYNTAAFLTSGIIVTQLSNGWQIDNLPNNYDYEILSTTAFQAIQVDSISTSSTFKLGFVDLNALVIQGVSFSVPVRLSDYDGDYVDNSIPINLSAPPLVFDLNGDGAKFLSLAAGVHFAYNGVPVLTAWVDPNDGLLAIDHNGNRLVDDATELVFGGPGQTDLQGLGNFDSNHDGVIDANDADWAKFGIWQDANSNGVTDDGEFRSLDDLGIASVSLTSDGIGYSAAGGDVTVHGTASYTKTDGSTGAVADAAFTLGGLQAGSDTGALDGDAMSALLAVNAAPADTQPAPDADPATVQDALADSSDALTVDAVVDHFAANDSAPPPAELDGGDLMALLNTSIGSTVDAAPPPMMADSYDDHAALAAAAA